MNPVRPAASLPAESLPAATASFSAPGVHDELRREARMGAVGVETRDREIRRIDLAGFERRRAGIADQVWDAAVDVGFFQVAGHGIAQADIDDAFAMTERFFALPEAVKSKYPHRKAHNVGWENRAQVRPSVGTPDQKESFQITRPHMDGLWPSDVELDAFRDTMLAFEAQCWRVGMQVLSCFALKLGFDTDFFARAHDPSAASYQSTLRLLHYHAIAEQDQERLGLWRAGAHTDFDCLTLLFQRAGQGGLQVCPGKEMDAQAWTPIEPDASVITCNIGDMLMRWSDDVLPSNFHRVRNPQPGEYMGPRYSLAFFCQANRDAIIAGPGGKYPPITAGDYLNQRIAANFRPT